MVKIDGRRKRQARLLNLRSILIGAGVVSLAALQSPVVPARESRIAGEARSAAVTLREGGDPRVRLAAGEDLGAALGQRAESLLASSGTPLSLASADFDGDGVPDLAAGYRLDNAGAIAFWRGNVDSIHPNAPDAMRRREKGEFLESPFFPSRLALETDEPPDWLFAGDFDGDGIADIVYAARGSSALHILPGNGAGGFRAPRRSDLPGAITAIAGGNLDLAGGTLGIAVAVLSGRGASLLFLDRGSSGTLDAVALPSPAAALAIVRSEGDAQSKVAAACGTDLLLVHRGMNAPPGAGSVERRPLPFFAAALEAGNFGTGSREGLALMAADGQSWLLLPGEVLAPEKLVRAPRVLAVAGQKQIHASPVPYLPSGGLSAIPASTSRAASLKDWALVEVSGSSPEQGVGIRAARLSGSEADDLLVLDGRGQRIEVVSASEPQDVGSGGGARASSARTFSSSFSSSALEVAGEPAAVLPMRLNSDAISDLVVLRSGSITPAVVLSASALSLTVNSNGDTGDVSPGNGICADSNGNCTLRAAIQEANASAGADTINFAIAGAGVHTITTGSSLPPITGAVTINGTTQSGYAGTPLIEIKGATGQIGLQIQVSDCVVRGLAINGYEASGQTGGVGIYIVSSGPLVKNALLEADFIGTDPAGTTAKPNHLGIDFENTSLHTVGGTTAAARNLISGNSLVGIQVIGPAASGNTFQGNYVGTTANGSAALPNAFAGFNLFANNTVVGGAAAGAGNVISGNGGGGLFTSQFCAPSCFGSGTVVKANKIGTNPAGDAAVGNTRGVLTSSPGSPNTTIANNLISGNPNGGIQIDESLTGVTTITGNFIGTDITGTQALGNGSNGGILIHTTVATAQVNVGGATGTTAGGSCTGSCNLISANSQYGIYAFGSGPVSIIYNYIGTDVTGTQALGNDSAGVVLAAAGKTVGASAASGNLISGNGNEFFGGVGVVSQSAGSPGNTIKGNLIGTNAAGTAAIGNIGNGVTLGASDTLGGSGGSNVISGNLAYGVTIPSGANFTTILNNFIGTRSNGAALGNGLDGVIVGSSNNVIGSAALGNRIAYNGNNGVTVTGSGTNNAIRGNVIHHNTALGIDLGGDGVTENDPGDPDSGPNDLMNFPDGVTTTYEFFADQTTIRGHIDTPTPNTVSIDIFANSVEDPSNHGQGEAFLGSATPDVDGFFCLTIAGLPPFASQPLDDGTLPPPPWISATATNAFGSTSEFSATTTDNAIELVALEVNQATQDWKNSIPLIKDKATYVRAHLQTTDPHGSAVTATLQLRGFRGGSELAGSPLTPFNYGIFPVKPDAVIRRAKFNDSANFRLPDDWLNGTIELRLERTDGPLACKEQAKKSAPGACSDCRTQVTFEEGSTVSLKFPKISWISPNGETWAWDTAHIDALVRQVNAIYPVATLPDVKRGNLDYPGLLPVSPNPQTSVLSLINKDLATMRLLDGCASVLGCERLYYGVILYLQAQEGGEANDIPGIVGSGELPTDPYRRRNRHAHELGHLLGHDHTASAALFGSGIDAKGVPYANAVCPPCIGNNPPKPSLFPNFFTLPVGSVATLGPMVSGENAKIFGVDTSDGPPKVPDPDHHFEVMSYCFNDPNWRWISDFTYKNMHTEIVARYPPSLNSPSTKKATTVQDYMLFRGTVDLATNAAQIEPVLRLPASGTPDLPAAGLYTLELRNGSNGLVSQVPFKPTVSVPELPSVPSTLGTFVIPVAFDASIRKALLTRDGVVLASRTASINSPAVTVTFPNGGENITQDPVLLQWTGIDADADPLNYTVQFSADNGATWDTLALAWPNQTLSVPRSSLKKTITGLIRVIASDGFNTAVDQSNAVFTVANNAPSVSILSPTAGQIFAGSQQMIFEAFARDVEDGLLSGASVQWTSSVNGSLGSGSTLLKQANLLTPGNHTITVTATDSGALSAQASVNINVAVAAVPVYADLTIAQSISPEPPVVGSPMVVTLTVSNAGPDTATGVTLTDTLPAGTSFGSAGSTQGSCLQSSGVVTCSLGSLAADAKATVTISVTPTGPDKKTNTASVAATQPDPVPADNVTTQEMFVEPVAPTVSNPANQAVCAGASAAFSATGAGTPPLLYRWRKNGYALSDGGSVSGSATGTLTINPTAVGDSGNYDVVVTDGFGQTKFSAAAVLAVNGPPVGTVSGPAAVCANRADNRASVPSAGAGATYAWSITNGVITSGAGTNRIAFSSGASGSVMLDVLVTSSCGSPAPGGLVIPIGACSAQPQSLVVDPAPDISNGNGILEPGERVIVRPSWKNTGGSPLPLSGTATSFTGPPGAIYVLNDPSAGYGSISAGATNNCATATGNCYEVTVSSTVTRPATHWDAQVTETLSDGDAPTTWPLHIGASFTDVPTTHTFYQFVERIFHNGVTTGCTPTTYCPDANVFRLQMAIFIARSQAGGDGNIPVSGSAQGNPYNCVSGGQSQFTDIAPDNPFCRHVHYIFSTGVTTGCVSTPPRQYCPNDNVTRGQMALFIARAVAGSDATVPQTYGPDPVTGRSYSCNAGTPNLHFTDIATSDIFCRHTHYLWARDVISGFPDGSYGPALPVIRGAMAKFLANGFGLSLIK